MSEWVAVVSEEGEEPIEIPTEVNGTILLSSLTAQFPGITGLKFRNATTNTLRGIRCHDNILFPPEGSNNSWAGYTYICTRPQGMETNKIKKEEAALKRKSENDSGGMSSKNQRVDQDGYSEGDGDDDMEESTATCDLIVLGVPWKATEQDIKNYFEAFGEVVMVLLKKKDSGQSKGFAFIRFKDIEVQKKVLLTRHMVMDRWCDVKVPESQMMKNSKAAASCKIFVARLSENITEVDLKDHFETFGTVTDVYIPKPFRGFSFVTFSESRVAQSLFGKDHIIKGTSVHIGSAQPKEKEFRPRTNGNPRDDKGMYGRRELTAVPYDSGYGTASYMAAQGYTAGLWNNGAAAGAGYTRTQHQRGYY